MLHPFHHRRRRVRDSPQVGRDLRGQELAHPQVHVAGQDIHLADGRPQPLDDRSQPGRLGGDDVIAVVHRRLFLVADGDVDDHVAQEPLGGDLRHRVLPDAL